MTNISGGVYEEKECEYVEHLVNTYPVIKFKDDQTYELKEGHSRSHQEQYIDIVRRFEKPIIVDFGGGCGINYQIVSHLPSEYYIIETPATLSYFEKHIHNSSFQMYDSIEKINKKIDIFYANASIQYIININKTINYIQDILQPKYILIQRTHFTSRKQTYWTRQNYIYSYTWVFNIDDFIGRFTKYKAEILPEHDFPTYNEVFGSFKEPCIYKPILFTRNN